MSTAIARAASALAHRDRGQVDRRQLGIDSNRARRAGNLVNWFEDQVETGKNIPEPVRAHLRRMFVKAGSTLTLPDDQAAAIALRIACRLNWLRAQHDMMSVPTDAKHFLTLSKVAAHWATMEKKLCGTKGVKDRDEKQRKPVPTSPQRPSASTEEEGSDDDGDTA